MESKDKLSAAEVESMANDLLPSMIKGTENICRFEFKGSDGFTYKVIYLQHSAPTINKGAPIWRLHSYTALKNEAK